jgi:NADH-quinone oxidoreductase subunit M
MPLLALVIAIPLLGVILSLLAGRVNPKAARVTSAVVAGFGALTSLVLLGLVLQSGPISAIYPWIPQIGSSLNLVADGISAPLVAMAGVLLLVAVLTAFGEIEERIPFFHACLHAAVAGVQIVFLSRDAFLFYFGYELMLIPIFLIIGNYGHENRTYAAVRFLIFTFGGSIFLLASMLFLHGMHLSMEGVRSFALDDLARTASRLSYEAQWWVYLGILLGFAVKIPLFPLHTWLPETYTQCPTAGNIVLAGIMSKTGLYGLMRMGEPLAPAAALDWTPFVLALALVSVFLAAWAAFAQRDIKRVLGYSSISHLGLATIGVLIATGPDSAGTKGAVIAMVAHGLATAALFLIAGLVQRAVKTRELAAYGGIWTNAPVMGGFLLFFSLASLGLPGTANFIGEIYIIAESFRQNPPLGALLATGVVFAAAYSLRLYILTMQGPETPRPRPVPEVGTIDAAVLGTLTGLVLILGFAPVAISPNQKNVREVDPAQRIALAPSHPRFAAPIISAWQAQRPSDDQTSSAHGILLLPNESIPAPTLSIRPSEAQQ